MAKANKSKMGGPRSGSGRKKLKITKQPVTLYISSQIIKNNQGVNNLRSIIYDYIENNF
jgi:hypothetical protein